MNLSLSFQVEHTGGNCTADVARVVCDRTGYVYAVVVTDGNLSALSESTLSPLYAEASVGVYAEGAWWGDDDDREPMSNAHGPVADLASLIIGAMAEAGISLPYTTVQEIADAHGLRLVDDTSNNINRRCDVLGAIGKPRRAWTVVDALKDPAMAGSVTHYMLRADNGGLAVTPVGRMTNLY